MKILYLIKKEFLEIFRQKEMLFLMLVAPIIQIIILGSIVTTDIKNVPVDIVNLSKNISANRIVTRIIRSPLFKVRSVSRRERDYSKILKRGDVRAVILLRDSKTKKSGFFNYPEVQVMSDGVDANSSRIATGYFNGIIRNYILKDIERRGKSPLVKGKPLIRFNPELKSINYMGPGIVALLLTTITLFLTSISLVREKEQQTMDTLLMSGLKPFEIYLGKTLPMGIVGVIDMVIGVVVVVMWFNIPVRGNMFFLLLSAMIFLSAILSYGMMISIFSSSQQQSLFFSWFSLITFILLSGLFTPVDNIPTGLKWLVKINPLAYFIRIIREIFLKGNGIEYFAKDLIYLAVIAIAISFFSIFNFKRFISK